MSSGIEVVGPAHEPVMRCSVTAGSSLEMSFAASVPTPASTAVASATLTTGVDWRNEIKSNLDPQLKCASKDQFTTSPAW